MLGDTMGDINYTLHNLNHVIATLSHLAICANFNLSIQRRGVGHSLQNNTFSGTLPIPRAGVEKR